MIKDKLTYSRCDSLRDIIEDNNRLLQVLDRFNISLGFGDGRVEQVCEANGVDTDTFLAVINFISGKSYDSYRISLLSLVEYLRNSHRCFIEYTLPDIKRTLIEGIHDVENPEIAIVILQFYDSYVEEVRKHMDYEDSVIFSYIGQLIDGRISDSLKIADFTVGHDHMAAKLNDLKDLFIYKYKQKNNRIINDALLSLMACGKDLTKHCQIENNLLFPHARQLEMDLYNKQFDQPDDEPDKADDTSDALTDREKEMLRWIAQGLSTKEIADRMCLSFHTVNSYRKNIGAKLNIHSVTGMAFYAVLHQIIDINEIEIP